MLNALLNELMYEVQNGSMKILWDELLNDMALSKTNHHQFCYHPLDGVILPISKRTRVWHKQALKGRATPLKQALYICRLRLKRTVRQLLVSRRQSWSRQWVRLWTFPKKEAPSSR